MPVFRVEHKKAYPLKEKGFEVELDLQEFIDENLEEFFGLKFIKREFGGQGFSIDTIAYDPETKGPVLIEYKKDTQVSVIDQGIAYLNLVLLQEKFKTKDVDWSQARVIFVARNYSTHQVHAAGMKGVPFELWRYDLYEDIFTLERVETPRSDVSLSSVIKTKAAKEISKEIRAPTVEEHLRKANTKIKELFEALREKTLSLDDRIVEKPVKTYIGYKTHGSNFVALEIKKDKIVAGLRIDKPQNSGLPIKKLPQSAWDTTPVWRFEVKKSGDLRAALDLIEQAYNYYEAKYTK